MGVKISGDVGLFEKMAGRTGRFTVAATGIAANEMKKYLERELPRIDGGELFGAVTVALASDGSGAVMVSVEVKPEQIDSVDRRTSVFYIRQNSVAGEMVAQHNPYGFDTFPVYTGINDADIIYRRVRPSEVDAINSMRKQLQPKLTQELQKIGVQVKYGASGLKHNVTRDAAFQLARMEYGIAGEAFNPVVGRIDDDKIIEQALLNDTKLWKDLLG